MSLVIGADAHVVEGAALAGEALARWPDKIQVRVPEGGRPIRERADLSNEERAKILGSNAQRFFGL